MLTLCMTPSFLIKSDISVLCCKPRAHGCIGLQVRNFEQYTEHSTKKKKKKKAKKMKEFLMCTL